MSHPDALARPVHHAAPPGAEGMPREPVDGDLAQLRSVLRRRSVEMASAGHDLRQPLQGVVGALERLGRLCRTDDDRFWLAAGRSEAERLGDGLTRLAGAAGIDGAQPALAATPVSALFAELDAQWRAAAAAKGVRLVFVNSSRSVRSDRSRLLTALGNLIGNAIRYTSAGGVIVGCREVRGRAAIDVVDTGPGFDVSDRARLTSAYVRGSAAAGGMGLGLWLVAEICDMLGHELAITARPGAGSRFRLLL